MAFIKTKYTIMGITLEILQVPTINQFDNDKYSHEDFKQFGVDLRGGLNTNLAVSGVTAAQRTAYIDALNIYITDTGSSKSDIAFQKGSTTDEGGAWDLAVEEVRRKEGLVRSKYKKGTGVYFQFFPQGLTPFNQAKKGDRLDLLDNLILRFGNFAADFPGAAATMASTKQTYMESAETQSDAKGSTKGGRTKRDLSRKALANNMYEIWLTICMANKGNPDIIPVFFNTAVFDKGSNNNNNNTGTIRLSVLDYSGNPIVNGFVEIRDQNNQILQQGTTNNFGFFESQELALGFYDVLCKQNGFVPREMQFQVLDDSSPVHEIKLTAE